MVRSMYSLVLTTLMGLLAGVTAEAQNVKVEFVTPSIVHVVKGEATKSLVVTAKPENVAVTQKGNTWTSSELTVRLDKG